MVKYVANIHGDETVTRELLLALAQHLVWNYGVNARVTELLNTTEVLHTALATPAAPSAPADPPGAKRQPRRLRVQGDRRLELAAPP